MLYGEVPDLVNSVMAFKNKEKTARPPLPAAAGPVKSADHTTYEDLLVAVGKTRNRDAFIRLFEHFAPRIKSFLMRGGLTQEMADELSQETMLAVWQKAGSFNPDRASASTWIFTIARNKRIDYFRRSGRAELDLDDPMMAPDYAPAPDQLISLRQQEKRLECALNELPRDQAEMIRKAFLEEKTHADIAAETGIPLGTVKSRIRLALERLRYHLGAGHENR